MFNKWVVIISVGDPQIIMAVIGPMSREEAFAFRPDQSKILKALREPKYSIFPIIPLSES